MTEELRSSWKMRWKTDQEIGSGGQGRVYRVHDLGGKLSPQATENALRECIREVAVGVNVSGSQEGVAHDLLELLKDISRNAQDERFGALKVLHDPTDARDANRAAERVEREIKAMSSISHPNLLEILDHNEQEQWYVSRYHAPGPMSGKDLFNGDVPRSLRAFRGLVEGVAELHKAGYVHRDIKPHNIFLSEQNTLVLGDFGLVFFEDDQHTRLSGTFENVGSRDWMPGWAYSLRIEDVRPSFDVFSLGKVLWSMVSGKSVLPLWYFNKPEHDVEKMFPDGQYLSLINSLLRRAVVEDEGNCMRDASELLAGVDEALQIIDAGADHISAHTVNRKCRVCGVGNYKLVADRDQGMVARNFGLDFGRNEWKVFACQNCGHVQLFAFGEGISPRAWDTV